MNVISVQIKLKKNSLTVKGFFCAIGKKIFIVITTIQWIVYDQNCFVHLHVQLYIDVEKVVISCMNLIHINAESKLKKKPQIHFQKWSFTNRTPYHTQTAKDIVQVRQCMCVYDLPLETNETAFIAFESNKQAKIKKKHTRKSAYNQCPQPKAHECVRKMATTNRQFCQTNDTRK